MAPWRMKLSALFRHSKDPTIGFSVALLPMKKIRRAALGFTFACGLTGATHLTSAQDTTLPPGAPLLPPQAPTTSS